MAKTKIKITMIDGGEINRTKRVHCYNCKAVVQNGNVGNLEFSIETTRPVFLENGELDFGDIRAYGSKFRIVKFHSTNGFWKYEEDIGDYFNQAYDRFVKTETDRLNLKDSKN